MSPVVVRRALIATVLVAVGAFLVVLVGTLTADTGDEQAGLDLVDKVAGERSSVLATADSVGSVLGVLGEPVRAWSEVSCSIDPRMSDGDGERDVIVSYYQVCSPIAYEIYALPTKHQSSARAAALLHGEPVGGPGECRVPISDALDQVSGDAADQNVDLTWMDPTAPGEECQLPEPGSSGATELEQTVDEPVTAPTYVVLSVVGMYDRVDVGCSDSWYRSCDGEPEDAPYLPEE